MKFVVSKFVVLGLMFATFTHGARGEAFRYFRFTPTQLRDGSAANSVQLAEFEVYAGATRLTGATASNPGGSNPAPETPAEAVDGNLSTKWLDFNKGPLVLDFGHAVEADGYRWATANDALERDAVSWRFDGSVDGATWTLLDQRTSFATPTTRFNYLPKFDFGALPKTPAIRVFEAEAGGIVSDQAIAVSSGTEVTLRWTVTNAVSLRLDPAGTTVAAHGELTVTPSATTTYTLVAQNSEGQSEASLTVLVDAVTQSVWINEFLSSGSRSAGAWLDEDGDAEDWIEIYNPNIFAVDLGGYALTDDADVLSKWRFPSPTVVGPASYLIVFASGKDRTTPGQLLHTNFKLDMDGEYLGFSDAAGGVVQEFAPAYPKQYPDISYGLTVPGDLASYDYFASPTPGAANVGEAGLPLVEPISITPDSRTFSGSLAVNLTTTIPGAEIRYTTDGTIPAATSTRFTGAFIVTASTQIRARAFQTGRAPGPVASATFIKLAADVETFSSNLPVFILDNYGKGGVPNGEPLQENFFMAFETNATGRTVLTNVPATIHRAGIARRGSSTLGDPKGNYRLEFWDQSNEDEDVSLLGLPKDPDWILFAPYRFDRALVRIPFIHQLSLNIGEYAPRSVLVELFLNENDRQLSMADYAGVYVLQERISRGNGRVDVERLDARDVELPEVSGGYILSIDRSDSPAESFRTTRGTPTLPPHGTPRPWFNYIYPKAEVIAPEQRDFIQGYLDQFETALYGPQFTNSLSGYPAFIDVDSFIDHHILIVLSKDPDGLRLSTFLHKPREGKLRMGPIWDFDRTMGCDADGRASNPAGWDPAPENAGFFIYDWWGRLFEDPDFWQRWIDRWQALRAGPMSDAAMSSLVDSLAGQLNEAQVRNFNRWPEVAPNGGSYSSLPGWPGEVEHLTGWLTRRAAWIDSQFPAQPRLSPNPGAIAPGTTVNFSGTTLPVYYTTDGSDPRRPGGGIASQARRFSSAGQIVTASTTFTARAYGGTNWSSLVVENYVVGTAAASTNLVVSEVHYHPATASVAEAAAGFAAKDFEFIELLNVGSVPVDLHGVELAGGIRFRFDEGIASVLELAPGERTILVNNLEAFQTRYAGQLSSVRVAGIFEGDLNNDGDRLLLTAAGGQVIQDFTYNDQPPWPTAADGDGFSLVLMNPTRKPLPDHNDPLSWRSSTTVGGTPGRGEGLIFTGDRAADLNHNGQADFMDYALGMSVDPMAAMTPRIHLETLEVDGATNIYALVTFSQNAAAIDATLALQTAQNLENWQMDPTSFVPLRSRHTNGLDIITLRSKDPAGAGGYQFIRLVAE